MPVEETVRIEAQTDAPAVDDFDAYVTQRLKEANEEFAAEPDDEGENPTLDTPEPESTESAPVTEEVVPEDQPAAETPETPSESGTGEDNQDGKVKEGKNKGIPQSKLDEVTKARREAERKLAAETTAREALERELAALKSGKPAEEPKPTDEAPAVTETAPAETPKPVAPEMPTLESADGDWDEYQAALAKYNKETYPEYVEKLTDWKQDQREAARAKQDAEKTIAAKKAKEEAESQATTSAAEQEWNERLATAKAKHTDWEEVMSTDFGGAMYSPAMEAAIRGYKDAGDIIYYLAKHPEESKRIAAMTPHQDGLPGLKYQELLATAHEELIGIRLKLKASGGAPTSAATTPASPTAPKPPENPKPATSRAPRPPTPVSENAGSGSKDPKEAALSGSFDDYEARRRAQLNKSRR